MEADMQRADLAKREGGTFCKVTMKSKSVLRQRSLDQFLLRFAGAVAAANPGMLKTLNQMDTDEERMLFVSQLHKVRGLQIDVMR